MLAPDLLDDRVLPHYEVAEIGLDWVLTANGREDGGHPLHHADEPGLMVQQMEHRNTQGPHVPDQRLLRAREPNAQGGLPQRRTAQLALRVGEVVAG